VTPNLKFHTSAERPRVIEAWAFDLLDGVVEDDSAEAFWSVLLEHWSGFDRINHAVYEALFEALSPWHPGYPASEPQPWFDALPDSFEVYRGQNECSSDGLSWTASKDVAKRFAQGHRGFVATSPAVLTTSIPKADIAIADNSRNEFEIVPFSIPAAYTKDT
jgi:hypothetical protein